MKAESYTINSFRLHGEARALFRNSEPVTLSQRAVVLLRVLIERHGQLVTKDELIAIAWDGQVVEESNLTVQIASLRRALEQEPGGESWVETLPRRGYRYVGPAAIRRTRFAEGRRPSLPVSFPVVLPPPLAPADKPSIIVLPFQNLSGDPAQSYLGEGFAEDITTAMSRLKWLAVVARDSTDASVGGAADLQSLARARNIQYVLTGSTRLVGDRLRVSCQVIATKTWQAIFSEKYDRNLGDIFAVQDEITENLVAVIEPSLLNAEELRATERPIERLDCWGLIARAVGLIHRFEREANATAQQHLLKAIELDPGKRQGARHLGMGSVLGDPLLLGGRSPRLCQTCLGARSNGIAPGPAGAVGACRLRLQSEFQRSA